MTEKQEPRPVDNRAVDAARRWVQDALGLLGERYAEPDVGMGLHGWTRIDEERFQGDRYKTRTSKLLMPRQFSGVFLLRDS